jgi:hypothetical protein
MDRPRNVFAKRLTCETAALIQPASFVGMQGLYDAVCATRET